MNQLATKPKEQQMTIPALMEQYKDQIAKALPKHLTADRMARICLTEIRKNPSLMQCDPLSFMGAVIQCSTLGLEPGNALGHVYLIPFRNNNKGITECQVIPGYRGLIDIARRSGQIKSISSHIVKENDLFEYELGLDAKIVHKPAKGDRGETIYVYAVAHLKDGGVQFEVMDMDEVEKIKNRARYSNPVWKSDFDEMARKTAVRRLFKYLPTSIELRLVAELESATDSDMPQGNRSIIDVEYNPIGHELSEHATTVEEVNKQGEQEAKAKTKEETYKIFLAQVAEAKKKGSDLDIILGDYSKANEWPQSKLENAISVLIEAMKR